MRRLLIVFALISSGFTAEIIASSANNFSCPTPSLGHTKANSKHKYEVEQFLGLWNGVELYSHLEGESYDETCMRLKISEVNELNEEITFVKPTADLYNYTLSHRHLRLKFSYQAHSLSYVATVNMTNKSFWKSDEITAQVLKADDKFLKLTICHPTTSKLYSILLSKGDVDNEMLMNEQNLAMVLFNIQKSKVYSTTSIQTNCTEDIGAEQVESAGKDIQLSIISLVALLFARILMS